VVVTCGQVENTWSMVDSYNFVLVNTWWLYARWSVSVTDVIVLLGSVHVNERYCGKVYDTKYSKLLS